MEEATHVAWILVLSEAGARAKPLIVSNEASVVASSTSYETRLAALFVISYVLCIATILCKVKDIHFFQTDFVRNVTTVLHALDGVNALLIGLGMYYQNLYIVAIGLLCMTKVFLLHLLSRMVTGIKTHSLWSVVVQTTKTFLHHVGSFLFIAPTDHNVILITALWRFVSMNGHAAMTLRKHISAERYQWLMWKISHMRNAVLVVVLLLCLLDNNIRDGFASSACGHLAYLLVRMGPVFRIGSLYFPQEEALKRWASLTDLQRIQELVALKHPYFALELGILLTATLYFSALRVWWFIYKQT